MASTKTETKTSTTPTKATTPKRVTLNANAQKSLGILAVTEQDMRESWNAAQDLRARVAFEAYALSQGWAGKARTGVEIAAVLGTSKGNVSALTRAGAILNRAGAHAHGIGNAAVTLCQNTNAGQTAHLDALTSKALADAVRKATTAALAGKAQSQHRAPSTAGKGKGGKGSVQTPNPADATDSGRMLAALTSLRSVKTESLATADDAARKAIALAITSIRTECDRITKGLAVEDRTGQPTK